MRDMRTRTILKYTMIVLCTITVHVCYKRVASRAILHVYYLTVILSFNTCFNSHRIVDNNWFKKPYGQWLVIIEVLHTQ